MTKLQERLRVHAHWHLTRSGRAEDTIDLVREAADALDAAEAEIARLKEENFALAANQCHAGYSDEFGNHRCRYQDAAQPPAVGEDRPLDHTVIDAILPLVNHDGNKCLEILDALKAANLLRTKDAG